MIKNFKLVLVLISASFLGVAQDFSQHKDQLDMLPDSVRSAVIQRINSSDFNLPEIGGNDSILLEDEGDDDQAKTSIEQADELERRFVNSIKAGDPAKFQRGIKKINNMKNTKFSVLNGNDDE